MRGFFIGVVLLISGYAAGAIGGYAAVQLFSSNSHDRAVEAAMTGAFVSGPLLAVVFLVGGLLMRRGRSSEAG